MMTEKQYTELFEKILARLCQEPDPMLSMLEWMTKSLMEAEVIALLPILFCLVALRHTIHHLPPQYLNPLLHARLCTPINQKLIFNFSR